MVGTIFKSDLGDYVADQFGQWVDNLHKSDPPLPPITIPNPIEAVAPAPAVEQIGNALPISGQAVQDVGANARSAFLDWADSLNQPPLANTQRVSPLAPTPPNGTRVSDLPVSPAPLTGVEVPTPPSDFMQWTQQVESGLSPSTPPYTPPPPGGATAAPALHPVEEPATASDQVPAGGPTGGRWKTQFDFGSTYTGNYRTGTPHRGVDLVPSSGGGIGTPVEAFYPGTVSNIFRDSGAGGLVVYVQDDQGLTHAYMHLQDVAPGLQVGQRVDRGTPLARMGESGTEGSPHLHYEVRKNASNGDPIDRLIDPRPYLSGEGAPLAASRSPTGGIGGAFENLGGAVASAKQNGIQAFKDSFQPYAEYASRALGVDPSIVTAMAISESGGGNIPGNSFFGMKGSPFQTGSIDLPTWELVNGVRQNITDKFATFDSPKQAVDAWIDFLQKRTPGVFGAKTPEEFAAGLKAGGYMTDTAEHYAQTLRGLGAQAGDTTQTARTGASDVLGASQRLVGDTASSIGTAASGRVQDASSALTDWLYDRRADASKATDTLGGFKAPVTSAVGDVLGQIGELPGLSEADRAARRQALQESPLGQAYQSDIRKQLLPNITEPNHPLNVLADLQQKYADPQTGLVQSDADMTPEDQQRYRDALLAVGGMASPTARVGKVVDWGNKAVTIGVNNLLGGPAGMLSNALSGVGENLYRPLNTAIVRRELGPAFEDLRAQGGAIGDALADAWHTFRSGERRSQIGGADYPEAFPGWSGTLPFTSGNLRVNTALDEFNRKLADVGGQAAELARRQRANPGLDEFGLLDRFGQEIQAAGRSAQEAATFESGGTGIGADIAAARRALTDPNASPKDRAKGLLATILAPFSKIPDAILTRGVMGMPGLAEVRAATNVAKALKSGDRAAVQTALHQWVLTETVNAGIGWQVVQGNITGNGPDDPAKKRALMNARDENGDPIWQPNSLKVPTPWGSRWIPYSSLGPIAARLGLIANAVEQYKLAEGQVNPDYVKATSKALGETITDAWYLQNIGRVFQAMKNGTIFDAAGETLLDFGERYVPDAALANQLRQLMDPVVREPTNPLEDVANRIPGLSQFVAPRIDPATGQPVERPKDIGSLFTRSPAPGRPDPVNEALARHNLGVPQASDTLTRGSATLELNDDEKRRFLELSGPEVAKRVQSVTGAEGFDRLSPDQQRQRLEAAIRVGREAGEAKLWATIPLDERNQRVYAYREAQKRRGEPQVILPGR